MSGEIPNIVSVVELGSGSVKLLVAERGPGGGLVVLAKDLIGTNLAAGLAATGTSETGARVPDAVLGATDVALEGFAGQIAAIVEERGEAEMAVTVVTTAAGRAIGDLEPLESMVQRWFGVPLEVLSGEREAALSFAGAVLTRSEAVAVDGPALVFDIGSGSTEVAVGQVGETPATLSLPIGARTVTEEFLVSDPPRPEELSSALSVIEQYLDDVRRELPAADCGIVFSNGASIDIAAVEIGTGSPGDSVDSYRLTRPGVEEVFRALATERAEDRIHNPGLRPDGVIDIVGALCILVEFLRQFALDEVVIAEGGVRHGLAAELLPTR